MNLKNSIAQKDSLTSEIQIDSTQVNYFVGNIDSLSLGKLHSYDTILDRFSDYDPLKINPHFYQTLSNIGLPAKSKIYKFDDNIGFDLRTKYISNYLYSYKDTKYYKSLTPYTNLKYANGPKKEQLFQVIFSRNFFKERLTLGVDFRYIFSPGIYNRVFSDDKNLSVQAQYFTKNKRYGIIANYVHNKLQWQESGGITYDSLFSQDIETDRKIIGVNLNEAGNLVRTANVFFNHYFNLGRPSIQSKDSTDSGSKGMKLGRLTHSFLYERNNYVYFDNNPISSFYKDYAKPLDPEKTYDSIFIKKITNDIKWSNLNYEEKPEDKNVYFYAGLKSEYSEIGGFYNKRKYTQLIPESGFALKFLKSFFLNVDASYVFGKYNTDNYKLNASLTQYLGTKDKNIGQLNLYSKIAHSSPSWFYQEYHANNFDWKNNFQIQEILNLGGTYNIKGISLGADYSRISNYLYFDAKVRPSQYTDGLNILKIFARTKIPIWKLVFDSYFVYQKTDNSDIVRIPDFIGNISIYGNFFLFNKIASFQPGFEVTYNTEYYADKYMPALRTFYLQNETKIGNYPYVDIFLQLKIKRLRFFVKYEHLNGLLKDNRYYGTPEYPYQDAAIKFGLSWIFHN
ncbi:MAG: putative porin [Bacteroidales bacterium]